MTPLAHRIARELTLPASERAFIDPAGLLPRMSDIHCFEVSEVIDMASAMIGADGGKRLPHIAEALSFLPAPKTWIEWRVKGKSQRVGFLLEDEGASAAVRGAACGTWGMASQPGQFHLPLIGHVAVGKEIGVPHGMPDNLAEISARVASALIGALAFINTPRFVGRITHVPHAGLAKKLRRKTGLFPLNAWTEIKLNIKPPEPSGSVDRGFLTGERALHFVRSHLRIRLGQLELVRSHWRGDAERGIKQTRYKVSA